MNLFKRIPERFFSVLASPNRRLYWTALVTLHRQLEYELNIPADDYRTALGAALVDMELADEAELDEQEQTLLRAPNGKANMIIHRLQETGWLDIEYRDSTFEEVIAPRDYADRIIRLLLDLESAEEKEYNSLVFASYSGLKQAYLERSDRLYEALMSAKRNTNELVNDLKSLYHNIRYYHQIIGDAVDVNQLLHDYYDEYKSMIDRIYHPIKTMDSLPLYRQPILDILSGLLLDDELLGRAAERMVKQHPDTLLPDAERELKQTIYKLMETYSSVQEIVQQIDRKHRAYTRESVDSIKYRMSADHSIHGKLTELLQYYAVSQNSPQEDTALELLQSGICCERQAFADKNSLWHPNRKADRPPMGAHKVTAISAEDESDFVSSMNQSLQKRYSIIQARQYIDMAMQDQNEIRTENLPLEADAQFIMLLIAAVRSTDQASPYQIEFLPGEQDRNGYLIPNMRITKKASR